MGRLKLRLLPYVVFCAGAAGMSLQLVGSRLLAPHFGNSIFVWTSLIGVMLGFMALGNLLGGRLADRITSSDLLFWILAALSMSISLVAMIGAWTLGFFTEIESLRTGMVLAAASLFAVPCTLFGMVLPTSIRLRMQAVTDSGANIGSLSAISMMGNIAGTFATGFWLIALVGSRSLLAWIALLVILLAAVMGLSRGGKQMGDWWQGGRAGTLTPYKLLALGVAALLIVGAFVWHPQPASLREVRTFDTQYDHYLVGEFVQHQADAEPRPVRFLANSPRAMESAVYADTLEPFFFEYYNFYDIATAIAYAETADNTAFNSLMIGGGAFVYPRFFFQQYPSARMDVVEIDAALLDESKESFGLVPPANMGLYFEDGRMFLNRAVRHQQVGTGVQDGGQNDADGLYDLVILDAFNSSNNVPFQLTTRESMQHCADLMTDDAVLVMNMIASVEGDGSQFLASQYKTLREVFAQVEIYVVRPGAIEPGTPRNVAVIATNSTSFDLRRSIDAARPDFITHRVDPSSLIADASTAMVLTDDFAPVDQMLLSVNW
ncbi:MAG: fused MFS/spermidine synthase [Coriobacteriia bacterium]|nr:fused MFS/spermidine synthase [Coriobacteriia bacterium]